MPKYNFDKETFSQNLRFFLEVRGSETVNKYENELARCVKRHNLSSNIRSRIFNDPRCYWLDSFATLNYSGMSLELLGEAADSPEFARQHFPETLTDGQIF